MKLNWSSYVKIEKQYDYANENIASIEKVDDSDEVKKMTPLNAWKSIF